MIDQEKFGKFIAELRKSAGLSQAELAARLYVGREAVSKWERGVGLPSHTILLGLSKEFDITINELLYGERINKTNKDEVEKVPYKWIDKISEKLKRFKKLFIVTLILLIIIYLVSYFIFDYTSFKIYATYTSGGDFTFKPGLIVKCYDKLYFKFGNIINYKKDEIKDMTLYYGNIENRVKLLSGSTLEDTVVEIKEFEKLTNKDIKEVLQNLYVEITTQSEVEQYKVDVDLNFKSSILTKPSNKDSNKDTIDVESNTSSNNDFDKIKSKFKLKDGEYVYEFKYKEKKYKCVLDNNVIQTNINDNYLKYRLDNRIISIINSDGDATFDVSNKKCIYGSCDKLEKIINAFIASVLN